MVITVDFKNEQLRKLKLMDDGAIGELTGNDISEKVEAIKIIIDWGQDIANGFEITFNDAFTQFRKKIINKKKPKV